MYVCICLSAGFQCVAPGSCVQHVTHNFSTCAAEFPCKYEVSMGTSCDTTPQQHASTMDCALSQAHGIKEHTLYILEKQRALHKLQDDANTDTAKGFGVVDAYLSYSVWSKSANCIWLPASPVTSTQSVASSCVYQGRCWLLLGAGAVPCLPAPACMTPRS